MSFQPENQTEYSVQYLNENGMMIAVEPLDIDKVLQSSVSLFKAGVVFKTIFLEKLAKSPNIRKHLVDMINTDLQRGVIKPLPLKIFHSDELESALRFMSTEKYNEKIVIAMPNQSEMSNLRVKQKFVTDSKSVYIIKSKRTFSLIFQQFLGITRMQDHNQYVRHNEFGRMQTIAERISELWSGCWNI